MGINQNTSTDIDCIFRLMNYQGSYDVFTVGSMLYPNSSDRKSVRGNLKDISDWKPILQKAIDTHLAPILHKTFSGLNIQIPTDINNGFQNAYNQVIVRNIVLQKEFKDFAKVLNEHQIPLVPLKGIYLSEIIYKDLGLRHLSDIDVLIREQHLDQVCELMKNNGWSVKAILRRSSLEDEEFTHAHPYSLIKKHVTIELHTHLYSGNQGANISKEELWNDTRSEQFLGVEIRQFSNEMLLQHLCLHLHKHLFGTELKVLSFCDIREFLNVKRDEFSWQRFEQLAMTYKCKEDIGQILYLCSSYWKVAVPEEFLNIQCSKSELEERFWSFMGGYSKKTNTVLQNRLSINTRNIALLKSNRAKLAFIVGLTFPTAEFMRQCYNLNENDWLFPWYVYRPIELSIKAVKAIVSKR
jgi:hypothetical protein